MARQHGGFVALDDRDRIFEGAEKPLGPKHAMGTGRAPSRQGSTASPASGRSPLVVNVLDMICIESPTRMTRAGGNLLLALLATCWGCSTTPRPPGPSLQSYRLPERVTELPEIDSGLGLHTTTGNIHVVTGSQRQVAKQLTICAESEEPSESLGRAVPHRSALVIRTAAIVVDLDQEHRNALSRASAPILRLTLPVLGSELELRSHSGLDRHGGLRRRGSST